MNALKQAERAAHDEVQACMTRRDAIGDCFSPEWKAEHARGVLLCQAWKDATEAVYAAGIEHAPYWWRGGWQ